MILESCFCAARNRLFGFNNRINVVLEAKRGKRRKELTDALFADLAEIDKPLLVLFDTFEQASSEVKIWLSGPFLARAAQTTSVRVVIAGQEVPKSIIDWGHCSVLHNLSGVRDAQHWLPVVRGLHRQIPQPPAETYMAAICDALKGNPLQIMSWIQALDHETGVT